MTEDEKKRYFRPAYFGYVKEMDALYYRMANNRIKEAKAETEKYIRKYFAVSALLKSAVIIAVLYLYQAQSERPHRLLQS